MGKEGNVILEVKNLKKVYTTRFSSQQVTALSNVSFSVEEGEYVAIMGESGSGKTTLLMLLAGLDEPKGGSVLYKGEDIRDIGYDNYHKKDVQIIFQNYKCQNHIFFLIKSIVNTFYNCYNSKTII